MTRLQQRLLRWAERRLDLPELSDSIRELAADVAAREGERAARRWIWGEVGQALLRSAAAPFTNRGFAAPERREVWTMGGMLRDLRFTVRTLLRSPGFTAVAVVSLALGIGANTAIFTLVNAVLLRPLPVAQPERLFNIYTQDASNAGDGLIPVSVPNYEDLASSLRSFDEVVGIAGAGFGVQIGDADPVGSPAELVTGNYFTTLGVEAALGRLIQPADDFVEGEGAVAVLSHATWMRLFGGDPGIIGSTVRLNQQPFTVIGVTPENFKGHQTLTAPERIWVPFGMLRQVMPPNVLFFFEVRRALPLNLVARLAAGASPESAEAELAAVSRRLEEAYPDDNRNRRFVMVPTVEAAVGINERGALTQSSSLMMGTVGLVLLIACANLANLLLARSEGRSRELALRASLGASRSQLVQQVVTESVLLSLVGGALGLAMAGWGSRLLLNLASDLVPAEAVELGFDGRILLFTGALAIGTGLLFGLVPALRVARQDLNSILKEGGRQRASLVRSPVRSSLVVAEVALAFVGLVGAGLFLRSMHEAANTDFGFEIDGLGIAGYPLNGLSPAEGVQFMGAARDLALSVPGVEEAGFSTATPLSPTQVRTLVPEGVTNDAEGSSFVTVVPIMPGYLDAMGLEVSGGRPLGPDDLVEGAPAVAVVSTALADRYWPGENPIGKRFNYFADEVTREVVGVTTNISFGDLGAPPTPVAYMPFSQWPQGFAVLHLRMRGDGPSILASVREEILGIDANRQPQNVMMAEGLLSQVLRARRMGAGMVGVFGLVALILAVIGIHAVMSYVSAQRRHEIGIRMALGADPSNVLWMVVNDGMRLVVIGLVAGFGIALLGGRAIGGLLYDVRPSDPLTLLGAPALLALVAFLACFAPALRSTRTDPMEALSPD